MSEPRSVYKYPPEIEELAFSCYIQADRNVSRAHRMLLELCTGEEYLPDRTTVQRWSSQKQWDAKADEVIADNFPHLLRRDLARLQVLRGQALSEQAAIFAGERDHLNSAQIMARTTGISTVLQISGLGTAGAKADPGQLAPQQVAHALEEGLSPADRARRQRERLEAERV
jgi:hypothetical protein